MEFNEFVEHCKKHQDNIYVRERIDGKWQSVALGELSNERMGFWIDKWWERNQMPSRLKTEEEMKDNG